MWIKTFICNFCYKVMASEDYPIHLDQKHNDLFIAEEKLSVEQARKENVDLRDSN